MYAVSKTGDVNEVFWMCYEDGSIGSADGTANDTSQSVGIANNSNEWDLLFNNSKLGDGMFEYYWLASNGIMMNENVVWFGAFSANGGLVSIVTQLSSFGYDNVTEAQGLRPVVTLKSDIKIEKDANNIWQFIEN